LAAASAVNRPNGGKIARNGAWKGLVPDHGPAAGWHAEANPLPSVAAERRARSVSHLLAVIEQLEAGGAHFRSLRDPIDTTPQGMFSLQVLAAVDPARAGADRGAHQGRAVAADRATDAARSALGRCRARPEPHRGVHLDGGAAAPHRAAAGVRGIVEVTLLDRAPRQQGDDRLIRLVAGVAAAPDRTLQQIAAQLEAMRERTPSGGTRWHPSSVKHILRT
jgi:hypothetical protein